MQDGDAFFESYIRPFRLVERLELKCGYEKSFKLVEQHLLRNRYLLGIEKSLLDQEALSTICREMQMPADFAEALFANLDDANLVLLGFEQGIDDCTYKIYLEYWDRIRRRVAASRPPYEPMIMFHGYKWSAFDNSRAVLTDYTCYPRIGVDEIRRRIAELGPDNIVYDTALEIISAAAPMAGGQSFIYLEVSEGGNPRNSFDINLYSAGMTLKSIHAQVARLFRHYEIAQTELDRLCRETESRPLGHLSAGVDRSGRDFFTVYYENQP